MKNITNYITAASVLVFTVITTGCSGPRHFNKQAEREEMRSVDVIPYLHLKKGDAVADLGAGGGYFTFRLAEAVGEKGRVYSIDISRESLDYIAKKVKEKGLTNVTVVRADLDDSRLGPGTVDLVFIRNAYHDFQNRVPYFSKLRSVLKQAGRVVIIDYDPQKLGFFRNLFGHALEEKVIREEMKRAGYVLGKSYPVLKRQSFNVFITRSGRHHADGMQDRPFTPRSAP